MPCAEVEHLVQHTSPSPSTLATPSPISRMMPTVCLAAGALGAGDLRFDFLDQVGHDVSTSLLTSPASIAASLAAHAAVIDVAAHADPHAADERRVLLEGRLQPGRRTCAPGWRSMSSRRSPRQRRGALDDGRCRSSSSRTSRWKSERTPSAPRRPDAATPAATWRARADPAAVDEAQTEEMRAPSVCAFRVTFIAHAQLPWLFPPPAADGRRRSGSCR